MTSSSPITEGLLTVISGPSGVGKTTIVREVKVRLDAMFSVSATTRPRTAQEVEGKDYVFLSDAEFETMMNRGEFLEFATVFGQHSYGTPRQPVETALHDGHLVILEIDVQGGMQVREAMAEALLIFIMPPGTDVLLQRLRDRGRDDEQAIQRRFAEARSEISKAESSGVYDEFVVNDDLGQAIEQICGIIRHYCQGH